MKMIPPGTKYGNIEVLDDSYVHGKNRKYLARCSICNTEDYFFGNNLKKGNTTKCRGCSINQLREVNTTRILKFSNGVITHGLSNHYMYGAYQQMLRRCDWSGHIQWVDYGGRGIKVCERWKDSFVNFLEDMGERPEGMTLDRVDVNGNYEKSNCRWASYSEQGKNKRNTHYLEVNGVISSIHNWAELGKISVKNIVKRIKRGWNNEDAIFIPLKINPNLKDKQQ